VHKEGICAAGFLGQNAWRYFIDCTSEFGLGLGAINRGICGSIDDDVRSVLTNAVADLLRRRQVQSAAVVSD